MGLYTIANPSGPNGIQFLSLVRVGNRWTLTPWKRPEGLFVNELEVEIERIAPQYETIANNDGRHDFAHVDQPATFNPIANYLQHIHISSNTLVQSAHLPVFLFRLNQLGYLHQHRIPKLLRWAKHVLNFDEPPDDE